MLKSEGGAFARLLQGNGDLRPRRLALAGIAFDDLDLAETVALLDRAITGGTQGYVVTPNVDHVVQYQRDPAFRAACDGAALRVADGMPVVWGTRLLGRSLRARVAGADLLPALCEMAAERGHTVFLLGGQKGVADQAAARLAARYPGLRVAGTYTPPDRFEPFGEAGAAALWAVNATKPALLFVALGAPKQEFWVHHHWARLNATVVVCVGAALDFAAGTQRRAPRWMQRAGLEWLWRLALDPRRLWRRYLVRDGAFLGILLKEWWKERTRTFRK
ncbi:MAG TPA: WecB/TagA/CpsF family glycosyltransferase [bacterium]|nr:WecB/TagA/CpsF family glycosyltransferase [bacterium]